MAAKIVYNKPTFVIHLYSLSEIAQIVGGTLHGNGNTIIKSLSTDSRKIQLAETTLFVALKTPKNNGHLYISQAIRQNIGAILLSEKPSENCSYILVTDTLNALQALVTHHRNLFKIPVIAITGSNGKTIVKEYIHHLLKNKYAICRSPKSYNSQIGVPLSVWQLEAHHTLAVFEAGISKTQEMSVLENIIKPSIGVFTHLGDAHSANFESEDEKLSEKLTLFNRCSKVVCSASESKAIEALTARGKSVFTFGSCMSADIHVMRAMDGSFTLTHQGNSTALKLINKDKATLENTLTAIAVGVLMGENMDELVAKLDTLPSVDMRLQQVTGINECQLIIDYYNADYQSTVMALDFLKQQNIKPKTTVILSDIQQSEDENLYSSLNLLLLDNNISQLIGIGKNITAASKQFTLPALYYTDTATFLQQHPLYMFKNECILLKGAREFTFENITEKLRVKTHQTVLEVNLTRMQHNLNVIKSKVGANTKIMAMVKALAYGSGGFQIAKKLEYNQIDYLGVAYTDEATELRNSGIVLPIMVLNPDLNDLTPYLELNIQPVIFSFESLEKVKNENVKIHIEFDTGMHRLGFDTADLPELIRIIGQNKNIEIVSIFSHLAASDSTSLDDFTTKQIAEFTAICNAIEAALGHSVIKHLANSAGIERFTNARFDMVRLGIGLYGLSSDPAHTELLPVSTFKSYISQIKTVKAEEGIGYGQHDKAAHDRKIAIIAVGYADGYNRLFSQGKGGFVIQGKYAKVVGNVCMDMTMCDVTDIECKQGDEAVIFGDNPSVEAIATAIGTIPYEILTNVSERVNRVFFEE